MTESIEKYKNFNFVESQDWQYHIKNIYPVPNMSQLEKIKRKWYKSKIDPNLDINFDDPKNP